MPPSVEIGESEINVIQGDDETLTCRANGLPAPEITWYQNGIEVTRNTHPTIAVSRDGSSLTIYRAQVCCVFHNETALVSCSRYKTTRIEPMFTQTANINQRCTHQLLQAIFCGEDMEHGIVLL